MWLLREAGRRFDDVRRLCAARAFDWQGTGRCCEQCLAEAAARVRRECLRQLRVHYVVMREPRQHLDDVRVVVGCVGIYP